MKKNFLIYNLLLLAVFICSSCLEEDEKYAKKTESAGNIVIAIPDAALAAPPIGQPQLVQPDLNVVAGRFSITDDLMMSVTLSPVFSNLKINTLVTSNGARQEKASFSGTNGAVEWTYPVNTLAINNKAPDVGTSVVLELVASNDDNTKTSTRVFSVNVLDPLTLATANPTTAYGDSTISLSYSIPAFTSLATVSKVELFAKRGRKGTESLASTKTYGDKTSLTDKFSYKMPSDNPSGALDTIFFSVKATFGTGRSVTKTTTVRFINVPLATTTASIALYNPAVAGANLAKTGYDFGKRAYVKAGVDAEKETDLKLVITGLTMGFTAGTGNTTRFLKTTTANYTSAAYQPLKKLFTAPGAAIVTTANLFVGDVYIVEIDGVSATSSARYGVFQITNVTLTPDTDNADFITIDFKSK
jgi:hypothetical protein